MRPNEVYEMPETFLIVRAARVIGFNSQTDLNDPEKAKESIGSYVDDISGLILQSMDWLEKRYDRIDSAYIASYPKDRRYVMGMQAERKNAGRNGTPYSAKTAYGANRLQVVLRAVLLTSENE